MALSPGVLSKKPQQLVVVHVFKRREVSPQSVCNAGKIQSKAQEEINEVDLFQRPRIEHFRAREVALWPGTVVYPMVVALVFVVPHVVHVMQIEENGRSFQTRTT